MALLINATSTSEQWQTRRRQRRQWQQLGSSRSSRCSLSLVNHRRRTTSKTSSSGCFALFVCLLSTSFPPWLFLQLLPLVHSNGCSSSSSSSNSIPRSNNRYTHYPLHDDTTIQSSTTTTNTNYSNNSSSYYYHPPWNASPQIDSNGFLNEYYSRIPGAWEQDAKIGGKYGLRRGVHPSNYNNVRASQRRRHRHHERGNCLIPVQVRQVPGDGNCLFHSIAICLYHATHSTATNPNPPPPICWGGGDDKHWNHNEGGGGGGGEKDSKPHGNGWWESWKALLAGGQPQGSSSSYRTRSGSCTSATSSSTSLTQTRKDSQYHFPMTTIENIVQLRRTSLALRNAAVDVLSSTKSSSSSLILLHDKQTKRGDGFLGLGRYGHLLLLSRRGGDGGMLDRLGNYTKSIVPTLPFYSRRLFLQGEEYISSSELLNAASSQFNISGEEYCSLMRNEGYWGGGPEIVALCNYLKRPIFVYELIPKEDSSMGAHEWEEDDDEYNIPYCACSIPTSDKFVLRRMACFGSPKFDRKSPLHILSADSRFPDVDPKRVRKAGNHFLALFEVQSDHS